MIYGRMILIIDIYYNKILDIEGFSYFVSLNNPVANYIKVHNIHLDKKAYSYKTSIIQEKNNELSALIPLETVLAYTPFVKGSENLRKKYYKPSKNILTITPTTAGVLEF